MSFPSTPQMRVIAAALQANIPFIVWGAPGQGKTAKIESYGHKWFDHVETIVGGNREATDFLGLPIEKDGQVHYAPPAWAINANRAKSALILFDELTTAAPSVQKAMLRVFQEKYVGELKLGPNVRIAAAANPPELAADGWDLPAPVANRLMHLDWHFDIDEWLNGVSTNFTNTTTYDMKQLLGTYSELNRAETSALITSFLRERSSDMLAPAPPTDPEKAGKAWSSPRSWSNAIDVLSQLNPRDEDARLVALKGLISEGPAYEYVKWVADRRLPNPDDVLDNPKTAVDWTERPDVLFAISRTVAHIVISRGTPDQFEKAFQVMETFADNKRTDIALPAMKDLITSMPTGMGISPQLQKRFATLFETSGVLQIA